MDRAYDSQSKKFLVKETIPKTEPKLRAKIQPNKGRPNNCSNDIGGQTTISTHPLDEAMQELLDICQQYNDKIASNNNKKQQQQQQQPDTALDEPKLSSGMQAENKHLVAATDSKTTCDIELDKMKQDQNLQSTVGKNSSQYAQSNFLHNSTRPAVNDSESIEKLQEKQADLQRQLDEVLLVAKRLASKRKRNLTDILEDQEDLGIQSFVSKNQSTKKGDASNVDGEEEEEEEDELIEFQEIENELRVSDLRRQLDNIQEELRIRLFKRLVSNTGAKQQSSRSSAVSNPVDGRSPSSSSCSDTTSSIASNNGPTALSNNGPSRNAYIDETEREIRKFDVNDCPANGVLSDSVRSQDISGVTTADNEFHPIAYKRPDETSTPIKNHSESNCSDHDSAVGHSEALTPTTSKESVMSKKNQSVEVIYHQGSTKDTVSPYQAMSPYVHNTSPVHPNNHRNSSANSDLERIEEDEDEDEHDEQDFYCSSDKIRTIYEEKLSPKALGHVIVDCRSTEIEQRRTSPYLNQKKLQPSDDAIKLISSQQLSNSNPHPGRYKTQPPGEILSDFSKQPIYEASNRPLTLYLPKPDEEIDLIEHVQALGHDTSIISDDLSLGPKTAEGYLWKCCAKNNNKWLRRYFYYDRESRIVAYFKSKSQLTKKHPSPRHTIPFEEISDVYVDHRLSGLGDSGNSSTTKGRNFVFVLATIGRKYLLASSKAETMRAWIDILFTAAKANDYFEPLDDSDKLDDVNSDSLV